jgi:hypothetical protein
MDKEKPEGCGRGGRVAWHPAFYGALRLELEEYKDALSFEAERQLSAEPLIIDVVIVRKLAGVRIEKSIGRLFRERNIIEYKSPEDTLTAWDVHKGLAYSHLYMSQERVGVGEVTLTFVSGRRPRKALEYMERECGLEREEMEAGIHWLRGGDVAMQVIDTRRLDEEGNGWLCGLRRGLGAERLARVLERSRGRLEEGGMGAYLYAVLEANAEALKEVREMKGGYTLEKFVEEAGLAAKWRNQGLEKGMERGIAQGMERGIAQGMEKGIMQVARAMLRKRLPEELIRESTGLTAEQIRRLRRQDAL